MQVIPFFQRCTRRIVEVNRSRSDAMRRIHDGGQLRSHSTSRHSHLFSNPARKEIYDSMIRVNHAGEYGAQRIYEGQMAILGRSDVGPLIKEMRDQEIYHLKTFENLIRERRVRPTVLQPFWDVIGYGLGVGSALLGKEAAMALTVAVEEVIGEHYNDQVRTLNESGLLENEEDVKLKQTILEFRDDELEHLDIGLQNDAEKAPMYDAFTSLIKVGSRAAIWLSTRF